MKIKTLFILLFGMMMVGCQSKQQKPVSHQKVVTVSEKPSVKRLFYGGSIRPITVNTITSPVDGEVSEINFSYGQIVHKGQLLVKISSNKLQNEFHEAVSSYLKNKESYHNSKVSFNGSEQLYKEKIISRQEYTQEKTALENSEMSYLDSKFKLEQLIKSVPGLAAKVKKIDLDDIKNIRTIFNENFDEISLRAQRNGIVLFPVKKSDSDSGDKEIEVGSEMKKGQGLLSIGDLSGLGVVFDAGEMEINKLKPGQPVKVATPAIPSLVLEGNIDSVAVQAKVSSGYSDNAKFPVKIKVANIPDDVQKKLRVGMSVRVEVDLEKKPTIKVPLQAVKKVNGKTTVETYDPKTKKTHAREVDAGETSVKDIAILKGLSSGEHVIIHD